VSTGLQGFQAKPN